MTAVERELDDFGDRYAVLRKLGEGGMGVVYEVLDKERGTRVALKTTRRLEAAELFHFKREFRALADVSHRNLVSLYEFVIDGDRAFFTMELISGKTFLEHVRGGRCDFPRLRAALRQLARGVTALHGAGKLHRDIKPSNVLVTDEGRVVLLDFGLTTELAPPANATRTESVVGTAEYMSPEQAASEPLSEASDWYSVGTMLFEALTGSLPFGGGFIKVMTEKQLREPPPPSRLVDDVPPDLDELCAALLRMRVQARPSGAEVLHRLGAEVPAEAIPSRGQLPPSVVAPFVGRESHKARLAEAFEASRAGRTVVVHVHGSSGMGKTALVQRFVDDIAQQRDTVALAGRCYERESVPYKAWDSLVDALSRYLRALPREKANALLPLEILALTRVFPVLQRVEAIAAYPRRTFELPDPQEVRRRAFLAFREVFLRMAERMFVVLWLDDVQWGDVDSASLLVELLRRPDAPALLLILGHRSEEAATSPFLAAIRDARAAQNLAAEVRDIEVGPLALDDATRLAALLLGAGPGAKAEQIAREARGSPYFVDELVRYLDSNAGLEGDAPLRLDDALHRRVVRLPEDARRLLETVAIAGGPIAEGLALRAAEARPDTARNSLSLLRAEHLLRTAAQVTVLDTFHDRVRETVLARLGEEHTRRVHANLGIALLASGHADPDALVEHFRAAGDREREGEFAVAAGDKAVQGLAFDRAAALYERAIGSGADSGAALRALQRKRAEALTNGNRWGEAARVRLALAEEAEPVEALRLQTQAAEQFLCSGRFDEGARVLERVLRTVSVFVPASPWTTLLALLVARIALAVRGLRFHRGGEPLSPGRAVRLDALVAAGSGFAMTDNVRGAYFQTRVLLDSLRSGTPQRIVRGFAMEACFSASGGRRTESRTRELLAQTGSLAEELGTPYAGALHAGAKGWYHYFLGEFDEAERALVLAEERFCQCVGEAFWINSARLFRYRALGILGRHVELRSQVLDSVREARQAGDLYGTANFVAGPVATIRLGDDDVELAEQELLEVGELLPKSRFLIQHYYHRVAKAQLELYRGQADRALAVIEGSWKALQRSLLLRATIIRIIAWDVRGRASLACAAALTGREREVQLRAVAASAHRLAGEGYAWSDGLAAVHRAGMHALRGDAETALTLTREASGAFEKAAMKLHGAASRWAEGVLAGGDEGTSCIRRARELFLSEGVREPERFAAMLAPGFLLASRGQISA